jgi:hypothetical protein
MKRVALTLAGLAMATVALAQTPPPTTTEPRTSATPQEQRASPTDSRTRLSEADKLTLMNDCMRQVEADNPKVPEKNVRDYCDQAVKRYSQPR